MDVVDVADFPCELNSANEALGGENDFAVPEVEFAVYWKMASF